MIYNKLGKAAVGFAYAYLRRRYRREIRIRIGIGVGAFLLGIAAFLASRNVREG